MAGSSTEVIQAAQAGFAAQDAELEAARARQLRVVEVQRATGTGDVNHTFALDRRFRLVFVRCHFAGGSGMAPLALSLDSGVAAAYDTRLFTIVQAGTGKDVNLRCAADELAEPSPWTFQAGDAIRLNWTNPDGGNMTWGLEIGLALAT